MAELRVGRESTGAVVCCPSTMADDQKSQLDRFKELARELEADEDEERFEETVRKIAPKPEAVPKPKD